MKLDFTFAGEPRKCMVDNGESVRSVCSQVWRPQEWHLKTYGAANSGQVLVVRSEREHCWPDA
jgi:hypothetical protein